MPHEVFRGHLFCALTSQLVKATPADARRHMTGKRFQHGKGPRRPTACAYLRRARCRTQPLAQVHATRCRAHRAVAHVAPMHVTGAEKFMADERELCTEPEAAEEAPKPLRRQHVRSVGASTANSSSATSMEGSTSTSSQTPSEGEYKCSTADDAMSLGQHGNVPSVATHAATSTGRPGALPAPASEKQGASPPNLIGCQHPENGVSQACAHRSAAHTQVSQVAPSGVGCPHTSLDADMQGALGRPAAVTAMHTRARKRN
jgi:hypothetical protein